MFNHISIYSFFFKSIFQDFLRIHPDKVPFFYNEREKEKKSSLFVLLLLLPFEVVVIVVDVQVERAHSLALLIKRKK